MPIDTGTEEEPVTIQGTEKQAIDALQRLRSPMGGHGAILRAATVNLEVAGEGYLIGRQQVVDESEGIAPENNETWAFHSIDEVKSDGTDWWLQADPSKGAQTGVKLGDDDFILRIWYQHPRYSSKATSPLRGVLDSCEQVRLLEREIRAVAKSRLSNGLLAVPSELDFGKIDPATDAAGDGEDRDDPFTEELIDAMVEPIRTPGSAAAVVPLVVRGQAVHLKELRHVPLMRSVDAETLARLENAIRRIAQGLDIPAEVLLGLADTNHWSAWLVDEITWTKHLEPKAMMLVESLTLGYLWPVLQADNIANWNEYVIWYNADELIVRPNRQKDAKDAHASIVISDATLRTTLGFTDSDAPSEDEIARRLTLTRGTYDAILTEAMLRISGVPTGTVERAPTTSPGGPPAPDAAGSPSAPGQPGPPANQPGLTAAGRRVRPLGERLAAIDRELRTRLYTAADQTLRRALDRAGASIRSRVRRDRAATAAIRGVPNVDVAATLGPAILARFGITEDELMQEAFDTFGPRFDTWTAAAQEAALNLLELDPERAQSAAAAQASDRHDAWAWTAAALTTLAAASLYNPSPGAPPQGESDPSAMLPFGMIRESVARAGGAEGIGLGPGEIGIYIDGGTRPAGGVGTGQLIEDLVVEGGGSFEAWEWVYGEAPRLAPFEPHLELDGVIFSSWDDPVLTNTYGFPASATFAPGDHAGCLCDFVPTVIVTGGALPEEA